MDQLNIRYHSLVSPGRKTILLVSMTTRTPGSPLGYRTSSYLMALLFIRRMYEGWKDGGISEIIRGMPEVSQLSPTYSFGLLYCLPTVTVTSMTVPSNTALIVVRRRWTETLWPTWKFMVGGIKIDKLLAVRGTRGGTNRIGFGSEPLKVGLWGSNLNCTNFLYLESWKFWNAKKNRKFNLATADISHILVT